MRVATAHSLNSQKDTVEEACRRPDEKHHRDAEPERLAQLRRLLNDNVSLEHAWSELNQWRREGAPQSTVEALMFSLRDGVGALGRSPALRRLSELSDAQLREVAVRVQKFKPEIALPWASKGVEVLIVARGRVNA
jgi:hypothetical protein